MDSLITSIPRNMVIRGGKENGVASVQHYMMRILSSAYPNIYFDQQDLISPRGREHPCIVIDQVDFYSDGATFMGQGGDAGRKERLQMYFRCIVDMRMLDGTKQYVRRMRDHVFWVLTHAGVVCRAQNKFFCPPIYYMDFTKNPPENTGVVINVDRREGAIQDRFVASMHMPQLLQYDVLARFEYITKETLI